MPKKKTRNSVRRKPRKVKPVEQKLQKQVKKTKITRDTAVASLILNILIPGTGTLAAGETFQGVLQLVFWLLSAVMVLSVIWMIFGIPLMAAMWVWALISSISFLQRSR